MRAAVGAGAKVGADLAKEAAELARLERATQGTTRLASAIRGLRTALEEWRAARAAARMTAELEAKLLADAKKLEKLSTYMGKTVEKQAGGLSKQAEELERAKANGKAKGGGATSAEESGLKDKKAGVTKPKSYFGKVPDTIKTSSGVDIHPAPGKTTTILGNYQNDMRSIINAELEYPKTTDFSAKPDGFNVLNVPDELYDRKNPEKFWQEYNKPFLNDAVERGDVIQLATKPDSDFLFRLDENGNPVLTGFGKEFEYLEGLGFKYDATTGQMIKP